MSSKEPRNKLIKEIKRDGWYEVKQSGGHAQFKHPEKRGKVTIPFNITKNIELSVKKQAGLRS